MKYVFCCFYSEETEYEQIINENGVMTFVLDRERKTLEPIDVDDAIDHVGVDDARQVYILVSASGDSAVYIYVETPLRDS